MRVVRKRNVYWQIIRGFCIVAVVLIHCPNAMNSNNSVDYNAWLIMRQVIDFPVPVFIFMAGYFVNKNKCLTDSISRLKIRGGYLLVPYLLWTVLYSVFSSINDIGSVWKNIIYNIVTGEAAAPLYYILLLLQMEILLPFIIKGLGSKYTRIVFWMITPLYMVYVYAWYFATGIHPPLYGTLFPAYFIFYLMGIELQESVDVVRKHGSNLEIILVGSFLLGLIEATNLNRLGMPKFAVSQLKISSFIYSAVIIMILVKKNRMIEKAYGISSVFHKLGNDSYAIFFLHCLWLKIIGVVLRRIHFFITLPWLVQTATYLIFTILLCEITIYFVRTVADKFGFRKLLKYIAL